MPPSHTDFVNLACYIGYIINSLKSSYNNFWNETSNFRFLVRFPSTQITVSMFQYFLFATCFNSFATIWVWANVNLARCGVGTLHKTDGNFAKLILCSSVTTVIKNFALQCNFGLVYVIRTRKQFWTLPKPASLNSVLFE